MTQTTISENTSLTISDLTSNSLFLDQSRSAEKLRQKLASDALEKFQQAQNERWKQEQQWYLNLSFYLGQHYVQFRNPIGTRQFDMYVPNAPYYRVRPVINQIRKVVRKDIARLTAQKPNAYVIPASSEDRDVFAAQAGEEIWNHLWRQHGFDAIIREAVFWQVVCGNGFTKQFWDPQAIDPITRIPMEARNKQDNPNGYVYGDIVLRAETPFHVFIPDVREVRIEGQPFVIHAQTRNKQWVKQQLGIDVSENELSSVDEKLNTVYQVSNRNKESVLVLEVWSKPGCVPELPEGGMFTLANGQIVQGFEGWPYEHKEFPFSKLDAIPTGKFYTDSIIIDLIPLQRELNRTRGQIIEAKNKMAKPQLVAEEGSINPQAMTSEPGQVILYKMGRDAPQPLAMQNLPNYVTEEVDRIYTDIADLSGQHEVTQGSTPPGVTAAVAISYLQEQDESIISTFFDSLEEGVEKVARQALAYVKQYWDEKRSIKTVGVDKTFDVQTFQGSDLQDNTDIRVEGGSALPTSRAAKQAFIMDMMKMGFVDPREGLQVLEMGGLAKIYENVQIDIRQAQRENLKMRVATQEHAQRSLEEWEAKGPTVTTDMATGLRLDPPLLVPVNTWDNHAVHIEQHNRFRKSQAFDLLPEFNKVLFEQHVNNHTQAMLVGMPGQVPPGLADPLDPSLGSNPEVPQQQDIGTEQPPPMEGAPV